MPERTPAASNVDLSHSGTRGRCVTATYHESISRRTNAAEKPRSYAKARRIRRRDDNADRVISVQHHSYSRLSTAKYNVILSLPAGNYSPKGLGPGVRAWKQQKGNEMKALLATTAALAIVLASASFSPSFAYPSGHNHGITVSVGSNNGNGNGDGNSGNGNGNNNGNGNGNGNIGSTG